MEQRQKTNLSLFDIGTEFYALADLMEEEFDNETGELINKDEEIKKLFSELKGSFEDKLNNSHRYCLALNGEEEVLAKEIKRLQAKKSAITNKKDRLKKMMLSALQVSAIPKLTTEFYSFSVRKSESVNVIDEELINRKFLKISYSADKTKIKKSIKDGVPVEGAEIVKNESLNIR